MISQCEADGYTYRTVNRYGGSGSRCCSGRATLTPGTSIGGTGTGASGLWVCGGTGAGVGGGTPLITPTPAASATPVGQATPTPTRDVRGLGGYLAQCDAGGSVGSTDPIIGVNVQTNGTILAAVDTRNSVGATIYINGRRVSGTTFTLKKGDVLSVRTAQGEYVATTDDLAVRESVSVLIPMPCIASAGTDSTGRQLAKISPTAAMAAGLKTGEFEVWYRLSDSGTDDSWKKLDWLACSANKNSCPVVTGIVEAKIKTISNSAIGGAGNWSLTTSKQFGQ